jgi:hypothetical protein
MAPVDWEETFRHKRVHGRLWARPRIARPLSRRSGRPLRPPTWDQVFGVLLGPLGFMALAAMAPSTTSSQLVGVAYLGAGLAGIAVSAVDDLRSDWRARMIWSIGALGLGAILLAGGAPSLPGRAAEAASLALQTFAALAVLGGLRRRRRLLVHAVAAASAAAPTVLIVATLSHTPLIAGWTLGALHALSLVAFGLARVARRPRGLRTLPRER